MAKISPPLALFSPRAALFDVAQASDRPGVGTSGADAGAFSCIDDETFANAGTFFASPGARSASRTPESPAHDPHPSLHAPSAGRTQPHGGPSGPEIDADTFSVHLDFNLLLSETMPMVDTLTTAERSERMSRIRGKDTTPEFLVRRFLHSEGFRFRLHRKDLPGKPDLVLPKYGVVVFVQGCFWHAHHCQKGRIPGSRSTFWATKFETNKKRDVRNVRKLRSMGWRVLNVWECELTTVAKRERALRRLAGKIRRGV